MDSSSYIWGGQKRLPLAIATPSKTSRVKFSSAEPLCLSRHSLTAKTGQKVAPKQMGNFHPTDKHPKDKISNPSIPSRDIKFHFMWGRHLQKLFNTTSLQLSFLPKSDRMASSDLSHHRALPWPSTAALTVLMVRFCGDPKKTAPPGMLTLMVVTWLALI